jgi:micrococcal nuclease
MYEYRARVLRIVDADTLDVELDLGLDVRIRNGLRLGHVNAPEKNTPEGKAAIVFVTQLLGAFPTTEWPLTIRTAKDRREKYGRYLADAVFLPDGRVLHEVLIAAGHGVPYEGGKR